MTMQTAARTARSPEKSPLDGLRVLFLPKNSRLPYFKAFLSTARQEHDWTIDVVCPPIAVDSWRRAVGPQTGFAPIPDFNETAAWENDAAAVSEIDGFIGECERASGIPAGRILLAGERDIGRGFSESIYYWFRNKTSRRVLTDNATPFVFVRRMFAFARETLNATKPKVVLAGEWADPLCFTFYLVARHMGIRCIVNRPSKAWSGRCFWSDEPLMYNGAAREAVAECRRRNAPASRRAQERIATFRAAPTTLGYVQKNWEALDSRGWFAHHVTLAHALAIELRHYLQRRTGPAPKPALQLILEHYRRPLLKRYQARFFRRMSEEELRETRYIYIALHKDPEQALNYQAPFWSNQYNTVSLLSGLLPDGFTLLVREHRNNCGRRPTRYYKDLLKLPGVVLVDGFDDQFKYICNADLIVTENGSSGWEGLILGRRVIVLDESFYGTAGLARRVRDPGQLAAVVVEMLKQVPVKDAVAHDQTLGWLLDAEWQTTAPFDAATHAETFELLAGLLPQPAAHSESTLSPA